MPDLERFPQTDTEAPTPGKVPPPEPAPAPDPPDPREVVPGYETDLTAVGTDRQAAPPDGVDQPWTEVHPTGSAEVLRNVSIG